MANQASDKTMTKAALEELMEVVTSFKCRLCDFTAPSRSDMATHLQKTHIVTSTTPAEPQCSELQDVPSNPDPVVPLQVLTARESINLAGSHVELATPVESGEVVASVASNMPTTTYEAPIFFSNLGLTSNPVTGSPGRSLISTTLTDSKVLVSQSRPVGKSLSMVPSCQSDIQFLSLNSGSVAGRSGLPITSLQLTGSGLTLVSTSLDSASVPFVEHPKDLGTGPTSIAPVTKELFLCGICNMGFSAVEECNSHMEREHHVKVEGISVSDTVVDKYEQRISIGTQATGKRPGRKRKSEMPPPPQISSVKKAKEWMDPMHDDDENDEDWIPGRSLSSESRDGRQRRKIRAPKALKEDYVTEKKRTYRKRQMSQIMKECCQLQCSYMGCPTKFRSQESLDIHHQCHNKEDDAFTCVHCQEPFQFWKPLRIHLYRSHKVDCDMFQCDVCEYKTDTLHKLGVHREIHSETRPYTCDVCGKGFKQLSQMKNHQIIHTQHQRGVVGSSGGGGGNRERWFSHKTCEVCKRSFANSKCLKKHIEAVHGQNKPFKCQFCNHTTAWKAMLVLHERTHTGEKPFKCDVCPYATGDHNSLRRHKMRHTGQRQYKCQLCSYTCIQTISLKTHMHNKHPNAQGVVYTCQLCKFRSINKQIYDNHLEDHRNGLVPTEKLDASGGCAEAVTVRLEGNSIALLPEEEEPAQFQLQVKRMESGELHANKEDMDRLNAIPQLTHSGVDANQLIYSALNIGSHIDGLSYTAHLANGVQSTVMPTLQPARGVLSSYSITFQAPQQVLAAVQPPSSSSSSAVPTTPPVVVDFRTLTEDMEPAVEAASMLSEPSSQEVEAEGEGVMGLSEGSQSSGLEQVLYAQETEIEAVPKVADGAFHGSSTFQVLQVSDKAIPSSSGSEVRTTETLSASTTLVMTQEGVLPEVIVMDGNQVVQTLPQGTILGKVVESVVPQGEETMLVVAEGEGSVGEEAKEGRQKGEVIEKVVVDEQAVERVLVMAADSAEQNPGTSVLTGLKKEG